MIVSVVRPALFLFVLAVATPAFAQSAGPRILGLVQGTNTLVPFSPTTPGTLAPSIVVSGLATGEVLEAIDYRPATGALYGLASDGASTVRLYTINPTSGVASAVGAPVTLPTGGSTWDINFNPVVDRVRLVNDQNENARLVPDTGALAGDDTNLTAGALIDDVAYSNPVLGATTTTLYALDQATNGLATIGGLNGTPSPNTGQVTPVGPLGVTFAGAPSALDISTANIAYAVLRPTGGAASLYTVNLATGAATLVGSIGDGTISFDDIAVVDPGLVISPPTGTYTSRQLFDLVLLADAPGRTVTSGTVTFDGQDVTGIVVGCIRPGATTDGAQSFRCPDIGGPVVGTGTHTFQVRLIFSDGSVVQRAVTWTVVGVTEP